MDRSQLLGMVLVAVLGLNTVQTKNCCAPDQWQGLLSKTSGVSRNGPGRLTMVFISLKNNERILLLNSFHCNCEESNISY